MIGGVLESTQCKDDQDHLPNERSGIGAMGWPCFRGGAVLVLGTKEGMNVNCMIFYTPMVAPNFQDLTTRRIASRGRRYQSVADDCWKVEKAKDVVNLSLVAKCIYTKYSKTSSGLQSKLTNLRGIALFFGLRTA